MSVKIANDINNVIDLNSPQGNVIFLINAAKKLSARLGLNGVSIVADMQSSNYNHAVRVFDKHFGEYIVLEMSQSLKKEIFG